MTTDQTPPNDTGAPVWPQGGYAPGSYWCKCVSCNQQFTGDKRAYQCPDCIIQALRALLAERDLSAAREAAAALEMRNACLDALPDMGDDPVCPGWVIKTFLAKVTAIPTPEGAAVLDRLIAERVRKALIEVRNLIADRRNAQEPGPIFGAYNEAMGDVEAVRFLRSRGSKGGQS